MAKQYLVGVDVGTTGTKVIAFTPQGEAVADAYIEYSCTYPKPNWVEQDPQLLIDAVAGCSRKMFEKGTVKPEEVAGISVSAQRSCTIYVDKDNQPIKMISWLDNRAAQQVEEIEQVIGRDRFYDITGMPLCETWMLPKILHTRKHEPQVWNETVKVVQLQDLILYSLGAEEFYSDEPDATFYGLWDSSSFSFSQEILDAFSLNSTLFPQVRESGEKVGAVTEEVSRRTGFAPGTPLCIGIGDQNSAALGSGIVKKGMLSVSLGTGGLATVLLDNCYRDPMRQTMVTHHAIHGYWTFEGLQNAAAGAFRWFRDEIAALEKQEARGKGQDVYETLNEMIAQTPVGAKGLMMLPYFAGSAAPRWNAQAKGGFLGLTFAHDRACMARACVEGITMEQKDIMESIIRGGGKFSKVRIMGGATKSQVWNQIQADVYNLPCETLEVSDAAVLGAAICAGKGVGVFSSIEEAANAMVKLKKRYEPNPENAAAYRKLYEIYCETYEALNSHGIFRALEEIQQN